MRTVKLEMPFLQGNPTATLRRISCGDSQGGKAVGYEVFLRLRRNDPSALGKFCPYRWSCSGRLVHHELCFKPH